MDMGGPRYELLFRLLRALKRGREERRRKRLPPKRTHWVAEDQPFQATLENYGRPPDETWAIYLAEETGPESRLSPGFDPWTIFDRENGYAIYAKTCDTTLYVYTEDERRVYTKLRDFIDDVADANTSIHWKKTNLSPDDVVIRQVNIAVPYQTSAPQWAAVHQASLYARSRGVPLFVTSIY